MLYIYKICVYIYILDIYFLKKVSNKENNLVKRLYFVIYVGICW